MIRCIGGLFTLVCLFLIWDCSSKSWGSIGETKVPEAIHLIRKKKDVYPKCLAEMKLSGPGWINDSVYRYEHRVKVEIIPPDIIGMLKRLNNYCLKAVGIEPPTMEEANAQTQNLIDQTNQEETQRSGESI